MTTNGRPSGRLSPDGEGERRERLAKYFLSAPPYALQDPAQRALHRARLREMGKLELEEILQGAFLRRQGHLPEPVWGNPLPLLQNLLAAAQQLAATAGQPVLTFPARGIDFRFEAQMYPRPLCAAVATMLRLTCNAAPGRPVWMRLEERADRLTVTATAEEPIGEPPELAAIKESARWHGGDLALNENAIAMYCPRVSETPGTRQMASATAKAFLQDELSPVWTCFYAWLSSADSGSEGREG